MAIISAGWKFKALMILEYFFFSFAHRAVSLLFLFLFFPFTKVFLLASYLREIETT